MKLKKMDRVTWNDVAMENAFTVFINYLLVLRYPDGEILKRDSSCPWTVCSSHIGITKLQYAQFCYRLVIYVDLKIPSLFTINDLFAEVWIYVI